MITTTHAFEIVPTTPKPQYITNILLHHGTSTDHSSTESTLSYLQIDAEPELHETLYVCQGQARVSGAKAAVKAQLSDVLVQ